VHSSAYFHPKEPYAPRIARLGVYPHTYIHVNICTYVYTMCIYSYTDICVYINTYNHTCIYMYIYIYIYICMYVRRTPDEITHTITAALNLHLPPTFDWHCVVRIGLLGGYYGGFECIYWNRALTSVCRTVRSTMVPAHICEENVGPRVFICCNLYIYTPAHTHTHTTACTHIYTYTHEYTHTHACTHTHANVCEWRGC